MPLFTGTSELRSVNSHPLPHCPQFLTGFHAAQVSLQVNDPPQHQSTEATDKGHHTKLDFIIFFSSVVVVVVD